MKGKFVHIVRTTISLAVILIMQLLLLLNCHVYASGDSSIVVKKLGTASHGGQFRTIEVYGDYLYVARRSGNNGSVVVYDISDPEAPVLQTTTDPFLNEHSPIDSYHALAIHDGYLYYAATVGGSSKTSAEIRKFDLHNTPGDPEYIATYKATYSQAGRQEHFSGITVIGDKLYAGLQGATFVVSWDNTATTNSTGEEKIIESAAVVNYDVKNSRLMAYGTQLYAFSNSSKNFTAINTDTLGTLQNESSVRAAIISSDGYAYLAKNGTLKVIDVRDGYTGMTDATKQASFTVPSLTSSTSWGYINDNYLYFVDSKLLVFDISDPMSPVLISATETPVNGTNGMCAKGDYIYTCSVGYDTGIAWYLIKDYKLKLNSDTSVTTLPYTLSGNALDGTEISISLKSAEMSAPYSKNLTVNAGNWQDEISDIYNGDYVLTMDLYENGEKVMTQSKTLSVSLDKYSTVPELVNTTVNDTEPTKITVFGTPVNYDDNTVSITGSIPMGSRIGFKEVTVSVTDPDGTPLLNTKQRSLGQFNFTASLGDNPINNRDYTVVVSCEGIDSTETSYFRFYGEDFRISAVADINGGSTENMSGLIETYNGVLELPIKEGSVYYGLTNKTAVLTALADATVTSIDEIRTTFNAAVEKQKKIEDAVAQIDACTDKKTLAEVIEANASLLGIDLTIAPYTDLKDTGKEKIYEEIIADDTLTQEEITEIFSYDSCLLRLINYTTVSDIKNVLTKYNKSGLALSESAVQKYGNLDEEELLIVNQTIARIDSSEYFKELSEVEGIFETAVAAAKLPSGEQQTPTPSLDRGKGSTTGGGGFSYTSPAVTPAPDDNVPEAEQTGFTDLSKVAWAKDAIYYLADKGIVNGKSATEFAPNDGLTREEFVKLLVSATGVALSSDAVTFADVDTDAWYCPYVATAAKLGIVNGISETEFGVGQLLTREQMAVMLERFITYQNISLEAKNDIVFNDEISDYAVNSVKILADAGIMNGIGAGLFNGKGTATRAMGAKVLYEILIVDN